jgi:hypothetical protein
VLDALDWLVKWNLEYRKWYVMIDTVYRRDEFEKAHPEEVEPCAHLDVALDEEDTSAVGRACNTDASPVSSNPQGAGDEAEVLLMDEDEEDGGGAENRPGSIPAFGLSRFALPPAANGTFSTVNLPRVDVTVFAHPSTDFAFYEKAQPWLWPCGIGGPELLTTPKTHPLKQTKGRMSHENFAKHLLERGLDRRYQSEPLYYFSVYKYFMNRKVGSVSLLAANSEADVTQRTVEPNADETDANVEQALSAMRLSPAELAKQSKEIRVLVSRLKTYGTSLPGTTFYTQYHRQKNIIKNHMQ